MGVENDLVSPAVDEWNALEIEHHMHMARLRTGVQRFGERRLRGLFRQRADRGEVGDTAEVAARYQVAHVRPVSRARAGY
jgi:hypothetical protein